MLHLIVTGLNNRQSTGCASRHPTSLSAPAYPLRSICNPPPPPWMILCSTQSRVPWCWAGFICGPIVSQRGLGIPSPSAAPQAQCLVRDAEFEQRIIVPWTQRLVQSCPGITLSGASAQMHQCVAAATPCADGIAHNEHSLWVQFEGCVAPGAWHQNESVGKMAHRRGNDWGKGAWPPALRTGGRPVLSMERCRLDIALSIVHNLHNCPLTVHWHRRGMQERQRLVTSVRLSPTV